MDDRCEEGRGMEGGEGDGERTKCDEGRWRGECDGEGEGALVEEDEEDEGED